MGSALTDSHNRSLLEELDAALASVLRPAPKLLPSEWAEKYRQMSPEASAKKMGKWRNLPMQVAPMDSVVDPDVRSTVLIWSSQTAGKTEVLNNIVGYYMHQDPSSVFMIQPDLVMAETWSKDRISPMIRDTPVLAELSEDKGRSSTNTIYRKSFPGGHLTIAGANSPASLASRPMRVNLFDEIDRYPETAGREGDPILLTERRSDTYENAVSFKTSTPTVRGHSRIEKEWELSDKNHWFAVCQSCDEEQQLVWKQLKFDPEKPEDAYYECVHCSTKWNDDARVAAICAGNWKATAPFKGVRGYHLNGIYSLFGPKKGFKTRMHMMAQEFLTHKRMGKEGLKVWVNTFLAETWEDAQDVKPSWHKLYLRRENYTMAKIPKGVIILSAGIDIQENRIELETVGHGYGEETWGICHDVLHGDTKLPEIYGRMEMILIREFIREDHAKLRIKAAGFDTGYAGAQRQIYSWLRPRLGRCYYPFKGSSQKNAEPIGMALRSKVESVRLLQVGTNRIKAYIYSRATIEVPGPGFMHFPMSYSEEWFKQLLAEDFKTTTTAGTSFREFYMPSLKEDNSSIHNEGLDMRVYAMAALYARGPVNWENEDRRNVETIPLGHEGHVEIQRRDKSKRRSSLLAGLNMAA